MAKKTDLIDHERLGRILRAVEKPGRYIGGEGNLKRKDPRKVRAKVALVFPDVYEIGMSYLGQKILYSLLNARPDVLAERVFAPWPDFEEGLRKEGLPLYSLENKIPLAAFDIVGVSLLYELNFSNILTVLDRGGIPIRSSERVGAEPLVIAGGPAAFNPEPLAEIMDLFFIGDGEEAFNEIVDKVISLKKAGAERKVILQELSRIPGAYVPSLYNPARVENSPFLVPVPQGEGTPARIQKRILKTFRSSAFPARIIVPGVRTVFDRVAVETARGCPQNCRFCQATNIYFPFRVKSPNSVVRSTTAGLRQTGYEDASLTALSIGDYPYLEETVRVLMNGLEKQKISLSLSSLRPKTLSPEIVENIVKVRKTGFTLVPEAGTERLRRVINKKLNDQEIHDALAYAFSKGWKLVKLYYMVGLPTETEEDLAGIITQIKNIVGLGQKILKAPPRIHLSLSSFIPKPHTPFQWLPMDKEETLVEKQEFIRSGLRRFKSVEFKKHPVRTSLLEAAFSRGDRRLNGVLRAAWTKGARFDSWSDHFRYNIWLEAFREEGVAPDDYWRRIDTKAELPWDHIDTGIKKSHWLKELQAALEGRFSPSCFETNCGACGACDLSFLKEREFLEKIHVKIGEPQFMGEKTESPIRYRAVYAKKGPARFISHIDLIHVLQRAFRRAGVAVAQSQGFHPKMLVSYAPALALGMEGQNELLDFRAAALFDENTFIDRLNHVLPAGIRFHGLLKLAPEAPSLNSAIKGIIYSLNLRSAEIKEALSKAALKSACQASTVAGMAMALASGCRPDKSEGIDFAIEPNKKKFLMTISARPGKSPRPQDIVEQMLEIKNAVHVLTRERFVLEIPEGTAEGP